MEHPVDKIAVSDILCIRERFLTKESTLYKNKMKNSFEFSYFGFLFPANKVSQKYFYWLTVVCLGLF